VIPKGGGPFGESFARAASDVAKVEVVHGDPVAVRGTGRAKGVRVRVGDREHAIDADAVLIDAPRSPAYELCQQAGAELVHEPRGFVVRAAQGKIREGTWAVGEVVGVPFEAEAIEADAASVADSILRS
jgi:thioredoxin reductase